MKEPPKLGEVIEKSNSAWSQSHIPDPGSHNQILKELLGSQAT